MKLDRHVNRDGRGKYALIKLRETTASLAEIRRLAAEDGTRLPVDLGNTAETEFFVIRLRDKYAAPALVAYAEACMNDGELEFGQEVLELASRAEHHPSKRKPNPLGKWKE